MKDYGENGVWWKKKENKIKYSTGFTERLLG